MRNGIVTICCSLLFLPLSTHAQTGRDRLLQGEILYEILLGNPLDALLIYDSKAIHDRDLPAAADASLTDALLALGLSNTVETQIKLRSDDTQTRNTSNRDAYRLAWFYYSRRNPAQALQALDSIEGKIEGVSASQVDYLRALVYLSIGRFREAAELLNELPLIQQPRGYAQYNLAMTQLLGGEEDRGRATLANVGRLNTDDTDLLALKDLANIKLGYHYLQEGRLEQAKTSFDRVRLDGPFTNQALLGSGWTLISMGQTERAIVPWSMLHKQDAINDTIIEAKMALPFAYSKLGAHGKAANLYAHAIELFESEIARLDAASEAIRRGELDKVIVDSPAIQGEDWFISLSRSSDQPEIYLPLLLANDEIRDQAERHHQLARLSSRIEQGLNSIAVSTAYARLKQNRYESVLPAAENELQAIVQLMKNIIPPPPQQTGTANKPADPIAEVALLKKTYDNYLRARNASADYQQRLPEYSRELDALAKKLNRLDKKLDQAIADSGKQLEALALATLDQKRSQLKDYHHNALFALAESYDFATGKRR